MDSTHTLFKGLVLTAGHTVTTASGGTHVCNGTNGGAYPSPVATPTAALDTAMRLIGSHFVLGQNIEEALARAGAHAEFLYSFDMLGEGARSAADAEKYFDAYAAAIAARLVADEAAPSAVDAARSRVRCDACDISVAVVRIEAAELARFAITPAAEVPKSCVCRSIAA